MKTIRIVVLFVCMFSAPGFAQRMSRVSSGIDVGTGYLDQVWAPSAMFHQELSLNHFPWFRIGWGVRGYGNYQGRTDLLPKPSAEARDTLKYGRVSTNGISLLLGANFRVWRFDIGVNTDLVGVAFGVKRRGLYATDRMFQPDAESANYNAYIPTNPTSLNALPFFVRGQNGQSEVYLRYWISDRIGIKVGYMQGSTAYSSPEKLNNGHRRFSTDYALPYAAISFPIYN